MNNISFITSIWRITIKVLFVPFKMFYAIIAPNSYARFIGVHLGKTSKIYGSSYSMFSTNPWLIQIGEHCHIVQKTVFLTHDGGTLVLRHIVPDLEITKPIILGDYVYIGYGVLVLPGVVIGSNVVIGAGSVVTKNIPDNSVAVGVPAKVIKTIDEYLDKLKSESLHLGHLDGKSKDIELKKIYTTFSQKNDA